MITMIVLQFQCSFRDNSVHTKIQAARDSPPSLVVLSRAVFRYNLIEKACGTSIYPLVKKVRPKIKMTFVESTLSIFLLNQT